MRAYVGSVYWWFKLLSHRSQRCYADKICLVPEEKTEVLNAFKEFAATMGHDGHGRVRALRTENGMEYINKPFKQYLTAQGIKHETSATYTLEQNGLAEGTNRTPI